MSNFIRQIRCIGRCIVRTYPDKYQKPFLNLSAHLSIYAADSLQNPLNHGTHAFRSPDEEIARQNIELQRKKQAPAHILF